MRFPSVGPARAVRLTATLGLALGVVGCGGGESTGGDAGNGDAPGQRKSPCGLVDESEPNDAPEAAVPLGFGPNTSACIDSAMDRDLFVITEPDNGSGGYLQITITYFNEGNVRARLLAASDGGEILNDKPLGKTKGPEFFVAAAAGQKFHLEVTHPDAALPYGYRIAVKHTTIDDPYEPNDGAAAAKPITVGAEVSAFLFAGHTMAKTPALAAYEDAYAVPLGAGSANVSITTVPINMDMEVFVLDPTGKELIKKSSNELGGAVMFSVPTVGAGTHVLRVLPFTTVPVTAGTGTKLPEHFVRAYRLVVTQP